MVIVENVPIQPYSAVVKILGMDTNTFTYVMMGIFMLAMIAYYFINNQLKHKKNMEMVENHVYCEFKYKEGRSVFELCEIKNGRIKRSSKKKSDEDIEDYYGLPEHASTIDYPIGKQRLQQVQIPFYHFYSNLPAPQFPNDANKWKPDVVINMTSAMANITADESGLKIIAEEQRAAFQDLEGLKFLRSIPMIKYLVMGCAVLILVAVVLIFNQGSSIAMITKFLTGK